MHLNREKRRTCTFNLAEVGSEQYPLCSMRCAKSSGGRADEQHVVFLEAVWLRCITNGGATLCIRPYAVAIAHGLPERLFDLQRISWHSEGVKNELDGDDSTDQQIALGDMCRQREDR